MGRAPCCSKVGLHRGPWTPKEDALLTKYIHAHGEGQWRSLPKRAGLLRCGKSCRLRWMNYLRPDIKRGNISAEEDDLIIRMHSLLGNRWSLIAGRLPGRTDNEIKNYWNTHLSKRLKTTTTTQPPLPHKNKKKMKKKKQAKNKNNNNNNNNVEEILLMEEEEELLEEKKTNIYLPKPIRVKAMSIQRNYNTTESTTTLSLDSNNNGGSNSSSASGSSSQLEKEESPSELLHIKEVINYNLINWEDVENYDDFGIFIEEDQDQDHHNIDIVNNSNNNNNNNNASIVLSEEEENNDNNMGCHSLEKLYEEYFQLLKDTNNNANHCDQNQGELDSFAQSLFV